MKSVLGFGRMRIEPVEDIFDDGQPTERLTICKGGHRDPYQCPGMRLADRRGVNYTVRLGWLRVALLLSGR